MKSSYVVINGTFALIFSLVFIYSFLYPYNDHRIKCQYTLKNKEACPSCGLSRDFSNMVYLKYNSKTAYNSNSSRVFLFFSLQLLFRILVAVFLPKLKDLKKVKQLIKWDVIITSVLFVYSFYQLILGVVFKDNARF